MGNTASVTPKQVERERNRVTMTMPIRRERPTTSSEVLLRAAHLLNSSMSLEVFGLYTKASASRDRRRPIVPRRARERQRRR